MSFTYKSDSLTFLASLVSDIKGVEKVKPPSSAPLFVLCMGRISSVFSAFWAVVPLVILQLR